MKEIKQSGYLVICFKELEPISKDHFLASYQEPEPIVQFYKRSLNIQTEKKIKVFSTEMSSRFSRLSKIAFRYYYYYLTHTNDSIQNITEETKDNFDRVLVFHSKNIIEHYHEMQKILLLNSYMYRQIIKSGILSNLFLPFGYIKQKRLEQILQGNASCVNRYTFQMIQPVTDVNFRDNLYTIRPKKVAMA